MVFFSHMKQPHIIYTCPAQVGNYLATWDGTAFLSPAHDSMKLLKKILAASMEAAETEFSALAQTKPTKANRKKRVA